MTDTKYVNDDDGLPNYRLWCEPNPSTHEVNVELMAVISVVEFGLLRLCVSR